MAEKRSPTVAVIGLGACGLVTLKNLRETGFDAVGFESNDYVGGLWKHSKDPNKTSVLKTTVANLSKQLGCYTDFYYDDKVDDYPAAADVDEYLNRYADHFALRPHMKFGMRLDKIRRKDDRWRLDFSSKANQEPTSLEFDKVAICMGLKVQAPKIPDVKGLDTFTGQAFHSNAYTESTDYVGKRVLVVGLGNTGPDIAVDLTAHAKSVTLSHRRGNAIFARRGPNGRPGDHILTLRLTKFGGLFNKYFPELSQKGAVMGMRRMQAQYFPDIDSKWNLGIPQPPSRKAATLNDDLVPAIHAGKISLKPGIASISGSTITFSDSTTLSNIDTIIFATGFTSTYDFLCSEADPTRESPKEWSSLPGADGRPLPLLYQGIFSLDFPESLCFLGNSSLTPQAFLNFDISSLAVSQIWAGNSPLPSSQAMKAHVDSQIASVLDLAATGEVANTNQRNNWEWFEWVDEAAGLGVVKRVGYGFEGWKFWLSDMRLSAMVYDGMMTPAIFRLFDEGKRKPWAEARRVVEELNRTGMGKAKRLRR